MTKIKFFKNGNAFVGFECSGHTGYAENGQDVLCATISGISQSVVLGLRDVLKLDVRLSKNERNGYLKCELPKGLSESKLEKSQILFETFYASISDLISGYSKFISMEVIE